MRKIKAKVRRWKKGRCEGWKMRRWEDEKVRGLGKKGR
jgi:hypothetical protein